jgi:hypothetical protein
MEALYGKLEALEKQNAELGTKYSGVEETIVGILNKHLTPPPPPPKKPRAPRKLRKVSPAKPDSSPVKEDSPKKEVSFKEEVKEPCRQETYYCPPSSSQSYQKGDPQDYYNKIFSRR